MRLTLIANPDNIHIQRWIEFLAGRGHTITLVTDPFSKFRPPQCQEILIPRWTLLTNILAYRLTPKPYGNDLWKHMLTRPLVRASRPDLVHGFEAFNNGLATVWAGPYPRVLTPLGKEVHNDVNASKIVEFVVTRALRGVDMITTNDETMPDYLAGRFGIPRDRVRAFTWGVDLDVFHPGLEAEAERWRRELDIPTGVPVIFSPRNFREYWGAGILLDAVPQVLRDYPETIFVFLRGAGGDAEYFAAARRRAAAEGWAGSARFIDRLLDSNDLAALFNLASTFVSVPRSDLLAQTILEGMACGCLPVLADHPAYKKHARNGENALILGQYTASELAALLSEALKNRGLRAAARLAGPRRMAERENWRVNAPKMEEVYQEAVERYRRRQKI